MKKLAVLTISSNLSFLSAQITSVANQGFLSLNKFPLFCIVD